MNVTNVFLEVLYGLNIVLAVTVIFLERRNVSATWAWVMILFFIPVLGFILYIVFGQNLSRRRIFKWDKQVHKIIRKIVTNQMKMLNEDPKGFENPVIEQYKDLIYLHLNNAEAPITQHNDIQIFTDGNKKFEALLADIQSAKQHIHMQYYIVRNDELGGKIGEALAERARNGVKVRFLYDDSGSRRLSKKWISYLREAGCEVVPFFPSKLPLFNPRINYRNHRKLVTIDGEIGYIGGFNIGDEYLGLNPRFGYWRDTHLRITGTSVNNIQSRFLLDWNQAAKNKVAFKDYFVTHQIKNNGVGIQIVSSGPDSEWEQIKNGYIKMILAAKKYVYIQTPYFIPDDSLVNALKIAALSGVDVRIMIPDKPDHPFVYWATHSYVGDMLSAGAKVFKYENGFLHAKMVVVDDQIASVGTANMDVRSFRLNFEVNAFIYHAETARKLAAIFHTDAEKSSEMTRLGYRRRPLIIRFKESVSRLLSPVL